MAVAAPDEARVGVPEQGRYGVSREAGGEGVACEGVAGVVKAGERVVDASGFRALLPS